MSGRGSGAEPGGGVVRRCTACAIADLVRLYTCRQGERGAEGEGEGTSEGAGEGDQRSRSRSRSLPPTPHAPRPTLTAIHVVP